MQKSFDDANIGTDMMHRYLLPGTGIQLTSSVKKFEIHGPMEKVHNPDQMTRKAVISCTSEQCLILDLAS